MKLLIEKVDASTSVIDNEGNTPLHWAAQNGNLEMAKILLEEGNADVNHRDLRNGSALNKAALRNNTEMVVYFVENHGAYVYAEDSDSITPFYAASLLGNLPLLRFLFSKQDEEFNNKSVPLAYLIAMENRQFKISR